MKYNFWDTVPFPETQLDSPTGSTDFITVIPFFKNQNGWRTEEEIVNTYSKALLWCHHTFIKNTDAREYNVPVKFWVDVEIAHLVETYFKKYSKLDWEKNVLIVDFDKLTDGKKINNTGQTMFHVLDPQLEKYDRIMMLTDSLFVARESQIPLFEKLTGESADDKTLIHSMYTDCSQVLKHHHVLGQKTFDHSKTLELSPHPVNQHRINIWTHYINQCQSDKKLSPMEFTKKKFEELGMEEYLQFDFRTIPLVIGFNHVFPARHYREQRPEELKFIKRAAISFGFDELIFSHLACTTGRPIISLTDLIDTPLALWTHADPYNHWITDLLKNHTHNFVTHASPPVAPPDLFYEVTGIHNPDTHMPPKTAPPAKTPSTPFRRPKPTTLMTPAKKPALPHLKILAVVHPEHEPEVHKDCHAELIRRGFPAAEIEIYEIGADDLPTRSSSLSHDEKVYRWNFYKIISRIADRPDHTATLVVYDNCLPLQNYYNFVEEYNTLYSKDRKLRVIQYFWEDKHKHQPRDIVSELPHLHHGLKGGGDLLNVYTPRAAKEMIEIHDRNAEATVSELIEIYHTRSDSSGFYSHMRPQGDHIYFKSKPTGDIKLLDCEPSMLANEHVTRISGKPDPDEAFFRLYDIALGRHDPVPLEGFIVISGTQDGLITALAAHASCVSAKYDTPVVSVDYMDTDPDSAKSRSAKKAASTFTELGLQNHIVSVYHPSITLLEDLWHDPIKIAIINNDGAYHQVSTEIRLMHEHMAPGAWFIFQDHSAKTDSGVIPAVNQFFDDPNMSFEKYQVNDTLFVHLGDDK